MGSSQSAFQRSMPIRRHSLMQHCRQRWRRFADIEPPSAFASMGVQADPDSSLSSIKVTDLIILM